MTPQEKNNWSPEPFPEPRTFPTGWDGSALTPSNDRGHSGEETPSRGQTSEDGGWTPEKFPKPRTYPKNWSIDD